MKSWTIFGSPTFDLLLLPMQHKEIKKYYTLLSLYLAQSIPMSFFSTVIPVIMRMENYSLESIGYIQLIAMGLEYLFCDGKGLGAAQTHDANAALAPGSGYCCDCIIHGIRLWT